MPHLFCFVMNKWRQGEVKKLAQGHTAGRCQYKGLRWSAGLEISVTGVQILTSLLSMELFHLTC